MSHSIRKFLLPAAGMIATLPPDATVLHVHEQRNHVCLWIRATWANPTRIHRHFLFVMTGEEFPADARYLGSAHLNLGAIVAHAFELPAAAAMRRPTPAPTAPTAPRRVPESV